MENLNKIIKESGISFSGSITGMLLNYIVLILITRFLSPKEFGIFILAQTIINVSLVFVLFGTPRALDRYIPIFADQDEPGKIKTLIYDVLRITFGIALFFGIILFLGYYRSSEEVGIYKIYLQIAILLGFVLFSFGQIYKPIISGLIAKKKLDEVRDTYQRLTKWIFIIVAFGLSGVCLWHLLIQKFSCFFP